MKKDLFVKILLLGLLIRLMLMFLPGFKIDVGDWFAWSIRLSHFNFGQFYSKDIFTDYTPGYLYVLSVLGFLKNLFRLPDNIFYLVLKMPAIISDLIIGLILYKEIKNLSPKLALFASFLFLFNPAIIFNSAIWGQIDSILALFMLIAIVGLNRNNLILSSISFSLALIVKPQAIALAPLFIIFLIRNFSLFNLLKLLVPGFVLIFILTFPFFPNNTLINLAQHIFNTADEYPYTSLNAYNLWGTVGFWQFDSKLWNGLSYKNLGYLLLSGYWIIIIYFYLKKKLSIFAAAALAALAFFFLPTRVHERYLYPAITFLILVTAYLKNRLLIILTGALSILHFFNLYYVYVYYNEVYLKSPKILYDPALYNFLSDNSKNLSLISTALFILISIGIIKYYATSK
ncbi:MAG: hypothetical protein M1365_08405 [Actinobacteria bacterium]|nr:hypothetical protein [Actinomycetota bacterium]